MLAIACVKMKDAGETNVAIHSAEIVTFGSVNNGNNESFRDFHECVRAQFLIHANPFASNRARIDRFVLVT